MDNNSPKKTYIIAPNKLVAYVYLLFIIGCVTAGLGAIIGVIFANQQKKETDDVVLLNHLNYQVSIFWPSFWVGLVGLFTIIIFGLGMIIIIVNTIWFASRTLQGFLKLNKNESIA